MLPRGYYATREPSCRMLQTQFSFAVAHLPFVCGDQSKVTQGHGWAAAAAYVSVSLRT